jgi:phospholipase/carboxylesterase
VHEIGYPDPATFRATFARASAWLDALLADHGVAMERTVLGGFSQGAVMSYALGLSRGRPQPAALVALSGFIPTVERLDLDLDDRRGLPVAIGHGTYDPVIGVEWARQARERLEAAGAAVTYRESPLPHGIDPRFLRELAPWIAEAVARATKVAQR